MLYTPRWWETPETIEKLKQLFKQRSSIQIELHVGEVNRKGLEKKVGLKTYQLSDFEEIPKWNEFFNALKKYNVMILKLWSFELFKNF